MFRRGNVVFNQVTRQRTSMANARLLALRSAQTSQLVATPQAQAFSSGNRGQGKSQQGGGKGYLLSSMLALGGIAAATAVYMQQQQEQTVEAGTGLKNVPIPFASTLQEGEMQALKVGDADDQKILVARYQGKLYSTGNFCSHFGVPLNGGMLFDDKVMCPAHAAGFSIITGEPELAPGLDGIGSYPVVEQDGEAFVQIPQEGIPKKVPMPLTKRDPENKTHYVIVGGGPAGLNCAETLRQSGFTGQVTIISAEDLVPYDRTLLSKAILPGDASKWALRPSDYLADADIDVKLKSRVFAVKPEEKKVILTNGDKVFYDKLCIATGCNPWKPPAPGLDLPGVHPLRSSKDHAAIKAACQNAKKVVIIGANFIGTECASSLKASLKDGVEIDIVNGDPTPFFLPLGRELGSFYQREHEEHGVRFHNGVLIKQANKGDDGRVKSVTLADGRELDADVVILGMGVRPATKFLQGSGIEMDRMGGIVVDPFMQTNVKDVYAAGDVASVPYWPTGSRVRIEHWIVALEQGTNVAFNMMDKYVPFSGIPFFWTRQYNRSLQFIGCNMVGYKEVMIKGDLDKRSFLAYYVGENDKVVAVAGMGRNQQMLILYEALQQNVMPTASEIRSDKHTPDSIKKLLKQKPGASKCKRANCCKNKQAQQKAVTQ